MRYLIVVDMQNDFVTGSLGSKMAETIVPAVCEKIRSYKAQGYDFSFYKFCKSFINGFVCFVFGIF